MPDVQYEIVITKKQTVTPIDEQDSKGSGNNFLNKGTIKKIASYGAIKSFALPIISHEISLVSLKTGSQRAQEEANVKYNQLTKLAGAIETGVLGAQVGGLPGLIVAEAVYIGREFTGIMMRQREIDLQRSVENQSIAMRSVRAGTGGSR